VLQHRFAGDGDMRGHVVGNLLIVGLWELLGDHVDALDRVGRLLGARGRVLPMALVPMEIQAQVRGADPARPGDVVTVRGQVEVASTEGRIESIDLEPADPPVSPAALEAISDADWVVLGPGSWFTSVLPHVMVPALREALVTTRGRVVVVLNLAAQAGETGGFSAADHLAVLCDHAPDLRIHAVLADPDWVLGDELAELRAACDDAGATLVLRPVAVGDGSPRHDPRRLATAYADVVEGLTGTTTPPA